MFMPYMALLPVVLAGINDWTALHVAIQTAAGTEVTLPLSTPFSMTGYNHSWCLGIPADTSITIVGNGALFDMTPPNQPGARGCGFHVEAGATFVMSDVTMTGGFVQASRNAGAIRVNGGSVTLTKCTFRGNNVDCYSDLGGSIYIAAGVVTINSCTFDGGGRIEPAACGGTALDGGAIYVAGGALSLESCSFIGMYAKQDDGKGGALYFNSSSTGMIKNCSFGNATTPSSPGFDDIYREDGADVTFECADGSFGPSVKMSGNEITVIPPADLSCSTTQCATKCQQHHCQQCLAVNNVCYDEAASNCLAHPGWCWCGGPGGGTGL
jgi:hypothetical protein